MGFVTTNGTGTNLGNNNPEDVLTKVTSICNGSLLYTPDDCLDIVEVLSLLGELLIITSGFVGILVSPV